MHIGKRVGNDLLPGTQSGKSVECGLKKNGNKARVWLQTATEQKAGNGRQNNVRRNGDGWVSLAHGRRKYI